MSGHADTRTLEDLLEAGEVEAALIVKGDYTPQELELIRAAFGEGVKLGKQSAEAKLVEQADRIAWLEGEVAGWRIKNQQLRDAPERIIEVMGEGQPGYVVDAFGIACAAVDGTPSELAECEERQR